MATVWVCPRCKRNFQPFAGPQARCPHCGGTVTPPASAAGVRRVDVSTGFAALGGLFILAPIMFVLLLIAAAVLWAVIGTLPMLVVLAVVAVWGMQVVRRRWFGPQRRMSSR